jgi:hypothetical protein
MIRKICLARRKGARSCEMSALSAFDAPCSCTRLPFGNGDRKNIIGVSKCCGQKMNKQLPNGDVGREYDHTFENPPSP